MILVTGGTGFVGKEVVRQLKEVGYSVRVLTRKASRAEKLVAEYKVEVVEGDLTDAKVLDQAMKGVMAVVHLVGIIVEGPRTCFEQVHTASTQAVVQAAQRAGVRRVVYVSALGVRKYARSRYHTSKWEAEEVIRQSGLLFTVLRPSVIYGKKDHLVSLFAMLLNSPWSGWWLRLFPVLGGASRQVQPVHIEEVASSVVRSLSCSLSLGKTYEVCGPDRLSWLDLWTSLAAKLHKPFFVEDFPVFAVLRFLLALGVGLLPLLFVGACWGGELSVREGLAFLGGWLGCLWGLRQSKKVLFIPFPLLLVQIVDRVVCPWLPPYLRFSEQLAMLEEDNKGDAGPLEKDLGLQIRSWEEGLRDLFD